MGLALPVYSSYGFERAD